MDTAAANVGQSVNIIIPSEGGADDVGLTLTGVNIADVTAALTSQLNSGQFSTTDVKYVDYQQSAGEQQQFHPEARGMQQILGTAQKIYVNWPSKLTPDSLGKLPTQPIPSSCRQSHPKQMTQSQPRQVKNKMTVSNMQSENDLNSNMSNLNFPVVMTSVTGAERLGIKVPQMKPHSLQSSVNVANFPVHDSKPLKNVIFITQPQLISPNIAPSMHVQNVKQQTKTYNVVSPVYQSKLEKAVAGPRKMNKNSLKNVPQKSGTLPATSISKGQENMMVTSSCEQKPEIMTQTTSTTHTTESDSKTMTTENVIIGGKRSLIDSSKIANTGVALTEDQTSKTNTKLPPKTLEPSAKFPVLGLALESDSSKLNLHQSPVPKVKEHIKVKEYEDATLGKYMLEEMWHLRQIPITCDAIIYAGPLFDAPVKLHKIVLAAISPVIQQQVFNMNDHLLKLKLPSDIDVQAVNEFVNYIYHARLKITTGNVRDLYRISAIFNMDQLKKYCYDFCKLAGLGHLIINSPEHESIEALAVTDQADPQGSTTYDIADDAGIDHGTDKNDANIREKALIKRDSSVKPSPKKSAKKSAIDWMGSDDMQRNIPIRKRSRTRKGLTTESKLSVNTESEAGSKPTKTDVPDDCDTADSNNLPIEIDLLSTNLNSNSSNETSENLNIAEVSTDMPTESRLDTEMLTSLPDPFQSGHFDDSQLNLKILSQISSTSAVTDNQSKSKDNHHTELASPNTETKHVMSVSPVGNTDRMERMLKRKGKKAGTTVAPCKSTGENAKPETFDMDPTTETSGTSPSKKIRLRKSTSDEQEILPLKAVVQMRPPPKKRTKEIREMMKNEDQSENYPSLLEPPTVGQHKVISPIQEHESPKKTLKPLTKRKRLTIDKDIAHIATMLFERSKTLDGVVHFKCMYCGNEFTMGKRAINHVLNTHDVKVDEILAHISVENGNFSPKVCDLCGYKTKDSNFYYIHMHKYFRHGILLPKGWKPFTCDLCKKEFFTKFQLRDHKLIHFEDNPFCCEHCGSRFNSRNSLNSHVFHKHNSVRSHKCSVCAKSFKTMTQMLVHYRTHSGEKPFRCSECDYKSTTRGNLRLHLTNRHKLDSDVVKTKMSELKPTNSLSLKELENDIKNNKVLAFDCAKAQLAGNKNSKKTTENFDTHASVSLVETNTSRDPAISPALNVSSDMLVTVVNQEKEQMVIENDGNDMVFDNRIIPVLQSGYQDSLSVETEPVPVQLHTHSQSQLVDELYLSPQGVDKKGDIDVAHRQNERFIQDGLQYRDATGSQIIIIDGKQVNLIGQDQISVRDGNVVHYDSQNRDLTHTTFPEQNQLHSDVYVLSQDTGVQLREVQRTDITRGSRRIDPHSREARLLVREVFQENETIFLSNQIENQSQNIGQKDLDSTGQTNTNMFQDGQGISMDNIKGHGHYITPEGHVINSRRSTVHDLRTEAVDASIERHFMETEDVTQLMPLNYAQVPPPAYSATSHGIVNIDDTDIQDTTPDVAAMQIVANNHAQSNNENFQPPPTGGELDPTYVQVNQNTDTQQQYDQNVMFNSYKMYYPQNYQ